MFKDKLVRLQAAFIKEITISDDIKETTSAEEKVRIYNAIGEYYISFLFYRIGTKKILECLDKRDFSSLSDDELLSVRDVSEFLARAKGLAEGNVISLKIEGDVYARSLATAVLIYRELRERGLI